MLYLAMRMFWALGGILCIGLLYIAVNQKFVEKLTPSKDIATLESALESWALARALRKEVEEQHGKKAAEEYWQEVLPQLPNVQAYDLVFLFLSNKIQLERMFLRVLEHLRGVH